DGPVLSLGGIGQCPSSEEIWQALGIVTGKEQ
ncbi:hypothetical protein EVA_13649, partial [gut metagenome]